MTERRPGEAYDSQRLREEGVLAIRSILKRIAAAEHRRDYLKQQLEEKSDGGGNPNARGFIEAEIMAWEAGIAAMKHHHLVLQPDFSPYAAIKAIIEALESGDQGKVSIALAKCKSVLEMARQ